MAGEPHVAMTRRVSCDDPCVSCEGPMSVVKERPFRAASESPPKRPLGPVVASAARSARE
jgi:hypothetical protein